MIAKMRTMLYVDDVEKVASFWINLGAVEIERTALPDDSVNLVVQLSDQVELSFFTKSFIEAFSPEVLGNTPSLMLFTDKLVTLHAKIPNALPITTQNGLESFAFPDPEGNYFVFASM
ncbi:glyoxalase [Weissella ceti]|uniref:Glyoxalase n=2 Tax=Weissella ceti TaxID=759620 RepID=A0ABT3E609_9LACO|nr:glyoxalase [Weissella ceti]MCW0953861.1 glyoxalase [Weissella ceti]QVK12798.1 glyoxalase [Weissella ceti]